VTRDESDEDDDVEKSTGRAASCTPSTMLGRRSRLLARRDSSETLSSTMIEASTRMPKSIADRDQVAECRERIIGEAKSTAKGMVAGRYQCGPKSPSTQEINVTRNSPMRMTC